MEKKKRGTQNVYTVHKCDIKMLIQLQSTQQAAPAAAPTQSLQLHWTNHRRISLAHRNIATSQTTNSAHNSFFLWKNLRRYMSWNTADATHTASEKMLNQATRVLVSSAGAHHEHISTQRKTAQGWRAQHGCCQSTGLSCPMGVQYPRPPKVLSF